MGKFPSEIKGFASKFLQLQEKRHLADYDPTFKLTRFEVLTEIDEAEVAIRRLQASNLKHRKAFAVWTVIKKRSK